MRKRIVAAAAALVLAGLLLLPLLAAPAAAHEDRKVGKLVNMNYGLRAKLPPLSPGQHVVQVEFVAADHIPFEPRIMPQAAFEVAP
jgi:hypothetical protein